MVLPLPGPMAQVILLSAPSLAIYPALFLVMAVFVRLSITSEAPLPDNNNTTIDHQLCLASGCCAGNSKQYCCQHSVPAGCIYLYNCFIHFYCNYYKPTQPCHAVYNLIAELPVK